MAACVWLAGIAAAYAESPAPNVASSDQLNVQINDDRMTLAVAKVPQVYLYGPIDADAAQRIGALIQSHKIPQGSDIYLNSPGGDANAGMALGRLFRANNMGTHLGTPRRNARDPVVTKTSQCVDACAYAYVGGVYRWGPAGSDRFGAKSLAGDAQAIAPIKAYMREMGVNPLVFGMTPGGDVTWLDGDQMLGYGVANNGRLPPTATNTPASGTSTLSLTQTTRDGEHRLTLLCRANSLTVTAYYTIGTDRARQVAARATQFYFEIDHQPATERERVGISAVGPSVVFSQPISMVQLNQLLSARSMSAYASDKGGAVRYGFWMELDPVRSNLREYASSCRQMAGQAAPNKG